ncbi:hypothetical protein KSP40_PGU006588 [Platanthera guangdongensis]|uniref:Uncharacterized protein n=1 Tax=Platanthera guangdongensis TaxID=2320717 RepID=A0ABR2MWX8_9ASPA
MLYISRQPDKKSLIPPKLNTLISTFSTEPSLKLRSWQPEICNSSQIMAILKVLKMPHEQRHDEMEFSVYIFLPESRDGLVDADLTEMVDSSARILSVSSIFLKSVVKVNEEGA